MTYTTLIPADQLAAHIRESDWVIVDCRFTLADPAAAEAEYHGAHIAGAVYAHLERDLSGLVTATSGRHPLPDPARLAERLSAWGIGAGTQVVTYDAAGGAMAAARLWWLLRWLGHTAVAVLDGGWQAWQQQGLPLDDQPPANRRGEFRIQRRDELLIDAAGVRALLARQAGSRLLDARTPERFHGINEPIDPVAGHIPGAINLPFTGNLAADGRFLPAAHLHARLGKLAEEGSELICMCGSGVTACQNLLALEHAGVRGAKLYSGSWSEWISDPARPVQTG